MGKNSAFKQSLLSCVTSFRLNNRKENFQLFFFTIIFDSITLNATKMRRRKRAICAFLTQFYTASILIGSLPIPFPQLLIKPLCCRELVNKKSELIFSCFHNQRKKEKTTLPNQSALARAGNSNVLFLITRRACTSRILKWKSVQQLALFISLSEVVLTISNKLRLLQAWAFMCSL